jgi:hypothetical protein
MLVMHGPKAFENIFFERNAWVLKIIAEIFFEISFLA